MSLLYMSLTAGIMILAVALVRLLLGSRLPKQTFLILWALVLCRLILPFELPSPLSVYSTAPRAVAAVGQTVTAIQVGIPTELLPTAESPEPVYTVVGDVSLLPMLWVVGGLACAFFFLSVYLRSRRTFREALPVEDETAALWLAGQHLKRPLRVLQSDQVGAPLTYGILRPVILLPRSAERAEPDTLRLVLAHELIHVRRFDALWKLLLTAALCLHWWNPAVWLMYFLANRDLELSCDEAVVRALGDGGRSSYAMALIGMEAKQSGLFPLCNGFSKTAIEARVKAIMKFKKATVLTILAAVVVVAVVAVGFATSAAGPDSAPAEPAWLADGRALSTATLPENYAQEHYPQLMTLQVDGYENLTVEAYRAKILELAGPWGEGVLTEELARAAADRVLNDAKYTSTDAWFLLGTLPLTALDDWQGQRLYNTGVVLNISINIGIRYDIDNPNGITIGERDQHLLAYLVTYVRKVAESVAADNDTSDEEFEPLRKELIAQYDNSAMIAGITSVGYHKLGANSAPFEDTSVVTQETIQADPAVPADYEAVLSLMTEGYEKEILADFNAELRRKMSDTPGLSDAYQRVMEDLKAEVPVYPLTDAQGVFLTLTLAASYHENAARAIARDVKPGYSVSYQRASLGSNIDLGYTLTYKLNDLAALTVAQRDRSISSTAADITGWLDRATWFELTALSKQDLLRELNSHIVREQSNGIQFEPVGEGSLYYSFSKVGVYAPEGTPLEVGETAMNYLEAWGKGDRAKALGYRYYRTDSPNLEERKSAFLESTDVLNDYLIDSVETLGENLWQVNITYNIAGQGISAVSNYVARIDDAFYFIASTQDVPEAFMPEGMIPT